MLKKALAAVALIAVTGCSASMDVDPNRTRYSSDTDYNAANRDTQVAYRSDRNDSASVSTNSDRYDHTYDAQARVASDRDNPSYKSSSSSYSSSYRAGSSAYNDKDTRSDNGPIMTDPIGRPERMGQQVQRDLQASTNGNTSGGGMNMNMMPDNRRRLTPEEAQREREIESRYNQTVNDKIPDKKGSNDPWGIVRKK